MNENDRVDKLFDDAEQLLDNQDLLMQAIGDPELRRRVLLQLRGLGEELMAIQAEQRAALKAALDAAQQATGNEDRVAKLIDAFVLCAKLKAFARDETMDLAIQQEAVDEMHRIAGLLDTAAPDGRLALAVLLDNPDPGVRASTGMFLVKLMPERVVPILEEINKSEGINSAGMTAHWALSFYEIEKDKRETP